MALEIFLDGYGFYTEGAEDRTSSMATHWLSAEDSTWKVWQHPANVCPMPEKPTALLNWPTEGIGMLIHLSDFLDSFALWLVYPSCTHFTLKGSNIDSVGLWVIWVQALVGQQQVHSVLLYCPLESESVCVCVCVWVSKQTIQRWFTQSAVGKQSNKGRRYGPHSATFQYKSV